MSWTGVRPGTITLSQVEDFIAGDPAFDTHIAAVAGSAIADINPAYVETVSRELVSAPAVWPVATRAILTKVRWLSEGAPVTGATFMVGAQGTLSTLDAGIYDLSGNRIRSSGATAIGSAGALQTLTWTSYTPAFGEEFFIAMSCLTGDASIARSAVYATAMTLLDDESIAFNVSHPLPATLNIAAPTGGTTYIPWIRVGA